MIMQLTQRSHRSGSLEFLRSYQTKKAERCGSTNEYWKQTGTDNVNNKLVLRKITSTKKLMRKKAKM